MKIFLSIIILNSIIFKNAFSDNYYNYSQKINLYEYNLNNTKIYKKHRDFNDFEILNKHLALICIIKKVENCRDFFNK